MEKSFAADMLKIITFMIISVGSQKREPNL